MYEHGIPSFIEFVAKTATMAEFLFVAVQCVSIRLLITSPMAMTTARSRSRVTANPTHGIS
jgi:hypothetical protein